MFLTLFLKECKQMLKCLTYYLIVICMVFFYTTQLGETGIISEPKPGMGDYGWTKSSDERVIMDETIKVFAREYAFNKYSTYPIGFYKEVTLNKAKQSQMGDILAEVTGWEKAELNSYLYKYYKEVMIDGDLMDKNSLTITSEDLDAPNSASFQTIQESDNYYAEEFLLSAVAEMTYEDFAKTMKRADKILGGGSSYAQDSLSSNAYVPKTYEQAVEEYNDILKQDHLSGAYARLFSDYMGITLAILPIFIAVTRGLRDRRARANEIIYSRSISSVKIIVSRYLAMLIMLLLPVFLLASSLAMESILAGSRIGIAVDYFAFPKYIGGWLLPTIMITVAVGMFLTELTDTAIAILIQGLWWFISLLSNSSLTGGHGWNLIPRHNALGQYQIFKEKFHILVANRLAYGMGAVLLILITVFVYEMKRKGRLNLRGKIFTNRKNKSQT